MVGLDLSRIKSAASDFDTAITVEDYNKILQCPDVAEFISKIELNDKDMLAFYNSDNPQGTKDDLDIIINKYALFRWKRDKYYEVVLESGRLPIQKNLITDKMNQKWWKASLELREEAKKRIIEAKKEFKKVQDEARELHKDNKLEIDGIDISELLIAEPDVEPIPEPDDEPIVPLDPSFGIEIPVLNDPDFKKSKLKTTGAFQDRLRYIQDCFTQKKIDFIKIELRNDTYHNHQQAVFFKTDGTLQDELGFIKQLNNRKPYSIEECTIDENGKNTPKDKYGEYTFSGDFLDILGPEEYLSFLSAITEPTAIEHLKSHPGQIMDTVSRLFYEKKDPAVVSQSFALIAKYGVVNQLINKVKGEFGEDTIQYELLRAKIVEQDELLGKQALDKAAKDKHVKQVDEIIESRLEQCSKTLAQCQQYQDTFNLANTEVTDKLPQILENIKKVERELMSDVVTHVNYPGIADKQDSTLFPTLKEPVPELHRNQELLKKLQIDLKAYSSINELNLEEFARGITTSKRSYGDILIDMASKPLDVMQKDIEELEKFQRILVTQIESTQKLSLTENKKDLTKLKSKAKVTQAKIDFIKSATPVAKEINQLSPNVQTFMNNQEASGIKQTPIEDISAMLDELEKVLESLNRLILNNNHSGNSSLITLRDYYDNSRLALEQEIDTKKAVQATLQQERDAKIAAQATLQQERNDKIVKQIDKTLELLRTLEATAGLAPESKAVMNLLHNKLRKNMIELYTKDNITSQDISEIKVKNKTDLVDIIKNNPAPRDLTGFENFCNAILRACASLVNYIYSERAAVKPHFYISPKTALQIDLDKAVEYLNQIISSTDNGLTFSDNIVNS